MSMSSSSTFASSRSVPMISSFQYMSTDSAVADPVEDDPPSAPLEPEVTLTERSLSERLAAARAAGIADTEGRLSQEFEQRVRRETSKISAAIADFEIARSTYFSRVEAEVVQLALAIAGKILHREAQVDPMLVAAIVHLSLGQLKDGSAVTVRVPPEDTQRWHQHFSGQVTKLLVNVIEDTELQSGDCVLDTELGTVNFSLTEQLKEVERGFFDVLAQRPKV